MKKSVLIAPLLLLIFFCQLRAQELNVLFVSLARLFKKSSILVIIILCLTNIDTIAQNTWFEDVAPHSPNVSALGEFRDIPVGNYTGTPQIDIPIYTLGSGSIKVPIILKYHASGLRVNEMSSWVGLGWALEAGGYVSRRVRGTPDEGPKGGGKNGVFNGYYQNYGPNMVLAVSPENWFVLDGVLDGSYDVEPDLFFFSFGSFSGSFFFDQYRKPHLLPEQDIKIDVNYTEGSPGRLNQFIITTPAGVKYYFGGLGSNGIEAIEYTFPNARVNLLADGYISNWYLTKVANGDNTDVINFEYEQESYQFFNLAQFRQTVREGICAGTSIPTQHYSGDQIDGVRLSKIITFNTTAEFIADITNPRKDVHGGNSYILKTISIKPNSTAGTPKDFELTSHWEECAGIQIEPGQDPALNEDKWRLILDRLQEKVSATEYNPPYKFTYYQLPSSTDATDIPKLPRRLSYDQDHWGYFNNAGNTYSNWLLPSITLPTFTCTTVNNFGDANREPQWPAMRAGTIKSVQYPTGGSTTFEFEPHNTYTYWTEPTIVKTFPVSVGNGGSIGINSSPSIDYTFPFPETGETLSVELFAQVTVQGSGVNCAEVHLYDDNNGGAEITGCSFDCSLISNPSITLPVTLVSGHAYKLRLVATDCMAQLIVTSTKIVNKEGYKSVGGLRISKITDSPADNGADIIKQYQYSNAALFSIPTYFREIIDNVGNNESALTCSAAGNERLYEISSSSVVPMLTSQGNHIGYGSVTVVEPGFGKSVYAYTNNLPSAFLALRFLKYPTPPPPYLFGNGNLIHETHFDESNNIVKEVNYDFETRIDTGTNVPASNAVSVFIPPGCGFGADEYDHLYGYNLSRWVNYSLYTGFNRLKQKTVTDHFSGGDISTTLSYEYSPNYISQLSAETQERSDKKVIKTLTMYPKDYLPTYQYSPTCYDQMQLDLHQCLQDYYTTLCSACYVTSVETLKSENEGCIANFNTNYYNLIALDKGNSDATTQSFYQMWEMNKILPIEQTMWIKDNQNTTNYTLTSANYFEYGKFTNSISGIEDIKLASVYEMPREFNLSDFTPSGVNNKSFSKDTRYALKVSAKYTKGRLTERWNNNDIHTQFYFGYNNSFPIAKIIGIDVIPANVKSELDKLDDETVDLNLVNTTIRNLLPGCMVTTYTYDPLKGVTSITDPRGETNYYIYNTFGKLYQILDNDRKVLKQYDYHYQGQ